MSPGKDEVPGPVVEDGPPAEGPVEEVDPAPEDQQEIQSTVALEARNIIFNCFGVGLKRGRDSSFWPKYNWRCCNSTFQPKGGTTALVFPMRAGVTGSSERQRGPAMLRFGQKPSKIEHQMSPKWCARYHATVTELHRRYSAKNSLLAVTWPLSQASTCTERWCAWFCAPTGPPRTSGWEDSGIWRCVAPPFHQCACGSSEWLLRLSDRSLCLAGWFLLDLRWLAPREAQAHVKCRQLCGIAR